MLTRNAITIATALAVSVSFMAAAAFSIPEDQLDEKKIFFGDSANFDVAGEVDIDEIIKATPEYEEIKKKKIERGTGKYWILLSQATERALEAVGEVGGETDYDLIAAKGYLGDLDPPITSDDVTDSVLEKVEDDS